jgi:hypothetical protein
MRKFFQALVGIALALAPSATASEPMGGSDATVSATSMESQVKMALTPAPEQKILGLLDIRPSWTTKAGEWHTENTLEGGYQFDRQTRLSYVQFANTNIYNPAAGNPGAISGVGLALQDGFLRFKRSELWVSSDKQTSVSYQARLYTPTFGARRDAGFISFLRQYFTWMHKAGIVDFIVSEAPAVYGYTQAGYSGTANPLLENMVVAELDIHLAKGVILSLPIIVEQFRYRSYAAGARYNNSWLNQLWAWPELDIEVTDHHTIGLAYYTDNFMRDDFSAFVPSRAVGNGVAQFIWTMVL